MTGARATLRLRLFSSASFALLQAATPVVAQTVEPAPEVEEEKSDIVADCARRL
jgi:hypothetical protein